jgi:hypothetical protein
MATARNLEPFVFDQVDSSLTALESPSQESARPRSARGGGNGRSRGGPGQHAARRPTDPDAKPNSGARPSPAEICCLPYLVSTLMVCFEPGGAQTSGTASCARAAKGATSPRSARRPTLAKSPVRSRRKGARRWTARRCSASARRPPIRPSRPSPSLAPTSPNPTPLVRRCAARASGLLTASQAAAPGRPLHRRSRSSCLVAPRTRTRVTLRRLAVAWRVLR